MNKYEVFGMSANEVYSQCARIADEIAEYIANEPSPCLCVYLADNGSERYVAWNNCAGGTTDLTGSFYVSDVSRLSDVDYLFEQVSDALSDLASAPVE